MPIRGSYPWRGGQREMSAPLNDGVSGPIDDLSGDNGVIEYRGPLAIEDGSGGDRYLQLPIGTTAQRPANPQGISLRYNTTISKIEFWDGSEWKNLVQAVRGAVTAANLIANGDVGPLKDQIAYGNHTH